MGVVIALITLFRLSYSGTKMKEMLPESAVLVFIGLALGVIICLTKNMDVREALRFPMTVFLYVFVPVIIFDATYFLNKNAFFHNLVEILTYAIIGTLISTVIVGLLYIATRTDVEFSSSEQLTFGALVSAVDPVAVIAIMESMHVNEDIYNLAFGESTLNDGVAIVMFNLFKGIDSLHS